VSGPSGCDADKIAADTLALEEATRDGADRRLG
jgi:hypothetical protein